MTTTTATQTSFLKADLAEPKASAELIALVDKAQHGGFIVVHSLTPKTGHGEVSTYTFCKGISYPNAVANSLVMLSAIESNPLYSVTVKRGTWQNDKGEVNPTNRKSKSYPKFVLVEQTYGHCDSVLATAIAKVKMSLIAPQEPTKDYKQLGNGIYQDETGTVYLRDLRLISKVVHTKGDYPQSASAEENAIADAIKADMPIGKYRMFRLDGDYERISIGGEHIESGEVVQEKEAIAIATEAVAAGE